MQNIKEKFTLTCSITLTIWVMYFFATLQKVIIPGATFDEIQHIFNTNAAKTAQLGAAFMFAYAVMQLVVGTLADRFGGRRVIAAGGSLLCISSLASGIGDSFALLFFWRGLTGIGAATIFLAMVKELSRISKDKFPFLLGTAQLIGFAGGIAGASPFVAGIQNFGYHKMVLGAGIASLLPYLLYVVLFSKSEPLPVLSESPVSAGNLKRIFTKSNMFQIYATATSFGIYFSLQSIIAKKFLEDFSSMTPAVAGIVLSLMLLISAFNGFLVAGVIKLMKNRNAFLIRCASCLMLMAVALVVLAVLTNFRNQFFFGAVMMLFPVAANLSPLILERLRATNPPEIFGAVASISNASAYLWVALAGMLAGKLMDVFPPATVDGVNIYGRNSYLLVFGTFAVLEIIAVISAFQIHDRKN